MLSVIVSMRMNREFWNVCPSFHGWVHRRFLLWYAHPDPFVDTRTEACIVWIRWLHARSMHHRKDCDIPFWAGEAIFMLWKRLRCSISCRRLEWALTLKAMYMCWSAPVIPYDWRAFEHRRFWSVQMTRPRCLCHPSHLWREGISNVQVVFCFWHRSAWSSFACPHTHSWFGNSASPLQWCQGTFSWFSPAYEVRCWKPTVKQNIVGIVSDLDCIPQQFMDNIRSLVNRHGSAFTSQRTTIHFCEVSKLVALIGGCQQATVDRNKRVSICQPRVRRRKPFLNFKDTWSNTLEAICLILYAALS